VAVYGVSFDSVEDNREFADDQAFPFPLLCDVNRELAMGLGVVTEADASWANRMTFIVDAEGRVQHAEETKNPAGQAEALLEFLR